MRWCQLKSGVLLLLAAGCIFCAKADLVFGNLDGVIEDKDNFHESIHLPYEPVSDTAYWDSIYGTDDIPDFDIPPEIEGESIMLDSIDEELDDVDDVGFSFAKRSADPRNLASVENNREIEDYQSSIKRKRSNSKEQSYRDDRSYWKNPFLPQYNEERENLKFIKEVESDSMTVRPETVEIIRGNHPMRTISTGDHHHSKHVPRLNIPETSYRSAATSAFAALSRNNGGWSFGDGVAEESDAYAESKDSLSGVTGGPGLSLGTSPVTGSSNYYILDNSDSGKFTSSSSAGGISEESGKSIVNYGQRKNVPLRPKHGTTRSHGLNLHNLHVNQPGCSCSKKMTIGDQDSHASLPVNLKQAVNAHLGKNENLGIRTEQLNDNSMSQASIVATIVERQESQTERSRTIGTQETVDSMKTANQILIDNNLHSTNVSESIKQSGAVADSASAAEKSGICSGSVVHSTAEASASAVQASTASVESALTSSAHITSSEREIVNDSTSHEHSVNMNTDAIVQAKGHTAIHSAVENVQQIHSSAISQEKKVVKSVTSSAGATSQVVQEHNNAVHVRDEESCEDPRSINVQQGTVLGAVAATSPTSSAHVVQVNTDMAQSVDQNTKHIMTNPQFAITSSGTSISAQQGAATESVQETVSSSARAGSEVILGNQGLAQSGVEAGHVIVNANSEITGADACERSSNLADEVVIASSNIHTGGHVVNSNSGLANVHIHSVGSISEVSSPSIQTKEEQLQASTRRVSESVSSQSATSAGAIANSAAIDQSISSSAGGVEDHLIQLDNDYDVDSAGLFHLSHGSGNSQSQSHSHTIASAHSSAGTNARSSSEAVASAKTEQVNVVSAASPSSQTVVPKPDLIQSAVQSHGIITSSNENVMTSGLSINPPCDDAVKLIVGRHTAIDSNIQDNGDSGTAVSPVSVNVASSAIDSSQSAANKVSKGSLVNLNTQTSDSVVMNSGIINNNDCDDILVENSASVYGNTKSTDSSLHNNQLSISSSINHANNVASFAAGSGVNSITEADSRVSEAKTLIDSTVGNANQVVIGSQAVDADDCIIASAPMVQDAGTVRINSESGTVKTASSNNAAARSSSSAIKSSSSSIKSSSSTRQSSSSVVRSNSYVNRINSLSAHSNAAASAGSAIGASVQKNVRTNSGSAHVHSASASRGSTSQLDRNLYTGSKATLTNDYVTRANKYNYGSTPVQKTRVPNRKVYIIENDPRSIKHVNIENYGGRSNDELEEIVDDEILESAIDKGSRLVGQVINDAAAEYNMNENTAWKDTIVDLAVKTVKKLVADVASEAARKISNAEVATMGSELETDRSSISNSGFDYVDTRRIQKCPWQGDWKQKNLRDLHRNGYSRYNDNGNRFGAEQPAGYRNQREISVYEGNKFGRKFLDNLHPDGKIHHFQYTHENVIAPEAHIDNNKLYNLNFHDDTRFIDLDVNCSDESLCMTPECKRLDYSLRSPNEGSPIPLRFIKTHLSQGHDLAMGMHDRARWLVSGGFQPKPHTASMLHFINNKVKDSILKIHEESELTLFAAKHLQDRLSTEYNVTSNTFLEFLHNHGFRVTGNRICETRPKRCGSLEKYRSYDGSCNNFHHPRWGQVNTAFTRIVPPRYSDGIHGVPLSVTGYELPNVRELSVKFFPQGNISNPDLTLALVLWGQVLSHDCAHQIMDQTSRGGIECCSSNGQGELPKNLQHHSCMPIVLPPRDQFYSKFGQRCMNFVRSMTVSKDDCTLGPAEQLNGATSYLDCSPVYGSDKNTCDSLRVFSGGLMKTETRRGRQMMPTMTDRSRYCDITSSSEVCYKAGDVRVNQNPHLVILQTLLVREHNRVAQELSKLNPHWSDEKIFQEARRFVIAEYQHITYHEWLPIVLGKRHCKKHRIIPNESGMSTDYNSRVNPAVINGFAAAAFRFFHSMVDGNLNLCPMDRSTSHTLRLSNHYLRPQIVERSNNFDDLIRGFVTQPMRASDPYFDSELTKYLFRSRNDYGLDLEAIDLQRSRDHGLPGYNTYRKICQLKYANDFDDLIGEIPREGIEKLRNIYAHVDDIDLLVGGAMETPITDGILGPTIRCLVSEQFYRSRVSDRYFYANANFPHSFTEEQYQEIKKVSLARLICDTSDDLKVIQYHSFKTISSKNPLVSCCDIPKPNLTAWQE